MNLFSRWSGGSQGFLSKYYPEGCGDFGKNPEGLTLMDGKRNGYFCISFFVQKNTPIKRG